MDCVRTLTKVKKHIPNIQNVRVNCNFKIMFQYIFNTLFQVLLLIFVLFISHLLSNQSPLLIMLAFCNKSNISSVSVHPESREWA